MMWSGAAHAVSGQQRHVERLGDHAFARERRVAVHDDRQHRRLVARVGRRARDALARARDALSDRIHQLEMARVRHELHVHHAAARRRRSSRRSPCGTSRRPCPNRSSSRRATPRTLRTTRDRIYPSRASSRSAVLDAPSRARLGARRRPRRARSPRRASARARRRLRSRSASRSRTPARGIARARRRR